MDSDPSGKFTAVVIDNGSFSMRAGLAGTEGPSVEFRTAVGVVSDGNKNKTYIGESAFNESDAEIIYPVKSGMITDWDAMERIWNNILFEQMALGNDDLRVLLSEPTYPDWGYHQSKVGYPGRDELLALENGWKSQREKVAEIMMETLNVDGMFLKDTAGLNMYGTGKSTGVVVDCGHHSTWITPVFEGITEPVHSLDVPIGGLHITQCLQRLLNEKRFDVNEHQCAAIKHKYGFVAKGKMEGMMQLPLCKHPDWLVSAYLRSIDRKSSDRLSFDIETQCGDYCGNTNEFIRQHIEYELPDGKTLELKGEQFQCAEVLFDTELLTEVLCRHLHGKSSHRHPFMPAASIYQNIVLCGNGSSFDGFSEKFEESLTAHIATYNIMYQHTWTGNITVAPWRSNLVWKGGSIKASLSTFDEKWITKQDYAETGSRVIHDKCRIEYVS